MQHAAAGGGCMGVYELRTEVIGLGPSCLALDCGDLVHYMSWVLRFGDWSSPLSDTV